MKLFKNLLKALLFLIFIVFGVIGVLAVYLYFTAPTDIVPQEYVVDYIQKQTTETVIKTVVKKQNLSPKQIQLLEEGNYEELAKDYEENITDEQIDCAVKAVGEKRAEELLETQDPTPAELLKLSRCL